MDVPDIAQGVTEPREKSWPPDFWPSPRVLLLYADTFIQEKRQNASPRMDGVKKKSPLSATDAPGPGLTPSWPTVQRLLLAATLLDASRKMTPDPSSPTSPVAPARPRTPRGPQGPLREPVTRRLVSGTRAGLQPYRLSLFRWLCPCGTGC